jgi:O-antigen/teichoic acid export membrane protein
MRSRTIARNGMLAAIDLAAGLMVGIIASVLVGRALGPSKLGEYNFLVWGITTVSLLASRGVPVTMWKFASEHRGGGRLDKAHTLVRASMWIQATLALVILACALGWLALFTSSAERPYAVPALLALPPAFLIAALNSAIALYEDMTWNVIPSLISTALSFAIVLLTLHFNWGLPGLAWSLLLPRLVDLSVRYYGFHAIYGRLLFEGGHIYSLEGISSDERRRFARYTGQVTMLMVVQAILWSRSEVWFLKRYRSAAEVSYFSLGFNFLDKINLLPNLIGEAVAPSMMVEYGRSRESAGRMSLATLRYIALFASPLVLGLFAISEPLVVTFYGTAFIPAILPMAIQALLLVPRIFLHPAQSMLSAAARVDLSIKWGLVLSAVNLALDSVLVTYGGAPGASLANGLAQLAATLVFWRCALREYGLQFPWTNVGRITGASAGMALGVWFMQFALPPHLGLALGIPVGALMFGFLLRWLGALDPHDRYRLLALEAYVPSPARRYYHRLIVWLTERGSAVPA